MSASCLLEAPGLKTALAQVCPEVTVFGAFGQFRVAEQRVVAADDLVFGVAHRA